MQAKALFPAVTFEVLPGPPPQSKSAPLDITRAKRFLGWQPNFTLRAAFEDYAAELRAARAGRRSFDC